MTTVHLVVPDGVDDPGRRSGGNVYDVRLREALRAHGHDVVEHQVPGAWPHLTARAWGPLGRLLAGLDDGALVLVDGLVACAVPELLVPQSGRLRVVVLVHLPLGLAAEDSAQDAAQDGAQVEVQDAAGAPDADTAQREQAVLEAAAAVVTTSAFTRSWLVGRYGLPARHVHVAAPGADLAPPVAGSSAGDRLLCVGAVTPTKGHDRLLAALREDGDLAWTCRCVGSATRTPAFAEGLVRRAERWGLGDRFVLAGERSGRALDAEYAGADVLLLASRTETYGLVVTEALARGLPVIATDVGGIGEALGHDPDGHRPGLLVPPGEPAPLAEAVRWWLGDPGLRLRLRESARRRRAALTPWTSTASRVADVLAATTRATVRR